MEAKQGLQKLTDSSMTFFLYIYKFFTNILLKTNIFSMDWFFIVQMLCWIFVQLRKVFTIQLDLCFIFPLDRSR